MIDQLLADLRQRQVRIWAEGRRLKYDAPAGALTDECIALLRDHREQLLDRLDTVGGRTPVRITAADRSCPLPLSYGQQRMWLLWKLAPLSAAYNIAFVVKLSGPLHEERLRRAVGEVRRRHEVLRTHFLETPEGATPVVTEAAFELQLREVDDEATLQRQMGEEAMKPFDLASRAPFEAQLYRLDGGLHCLFVKLHHIVADIGSVSIFLQELTACYEATGRAAYEPELQYGDFANWERTVLQGAARARLLSYWKQQLDGSFDLLRLPTKQFAASAESTSGDRVAFRLPDSLVVRLDDIGRSQKTTRFMILASAFRILLYRYTEQADILIGTPVSCRNQQGTAELIGYFGNTLVLRNPLTPKDAYLDVLARERRVALEGYEHQQLPFEMLMDELAKGRPLGRRPHLQVMISFAENTAPTAFRASDLRAEVEEVETSSAKFDLLLSMQDSGAGLHGVFEYPSHLFDRETIEAMAGHLELLLTDMARDLSAPICKAPLLTPHEKHVLLHTWNSSGPAIEPDRCVHEMFERQVEAHGRAVAIYYEEQKISFEQLNIAANRIAHRLLRRGVRAEEPVAVCLPRSPRLIAGLLGVLKAGGAYVPIDPSYPPERIRFILDDCRARVVIAEPGLCKVLPRWHGSLLSPENDSAPVSNPDLPATPGDLAYILYTSGSTGTPKGVMIEHRSAAALLGWAHDLFSEQELECVLAATSVCFDLSVFEIFGSICAGRSMALAQNALSLPLLPARRFITLINTVPSVMRAMLETHGDAFPDSLRVVNMAGERLETALVDEVYRRTGVAKIFDLYGPTETTTYATCKHRLPGIPASIGRPIANTRCYVLDSRGLPVPIGVVGELYIAGIGLARGYLNRPDLDVRKFVAPRNGYIPEERLYRTGDLVRYTREGELQYWGRDGDQLKVRGFRIEPAEVRAALLTADDVQDAWVLGRKDNAGETSLVAYVIIEPNRFSPKRLRLHLGQRLPEYMIPSIFARVDAVPLTVNGKVDLSQFAALADEERVSGSEFPRTETQRQVLAIWSDILGVEHIGMHDHFFELGGHSLAAIRVTARIGDVLGVMLPLQSIFQHPTVSGLSAEVDKACEAAVATKLPALRPSARDSSPTTLVQRHLWMMHRCVDDPQFLNIASCFGLRGPVDLSTAQRALHALADRHPILRARFRVRDGQLRQEVGREERVEVKVVDLSGVRDEVGRQRRLAAVHSDAARTFDLACGPCARFVIARFAEDDHVVTMVVHHIAADEWSLGVLGKEFAIDYEARLKGSPSPLAVPALAFADYATWEWECLKKHRFDEQLSRWKEILRPPLTRLSFDWRDGAADEPEQLESYPLQIDLQLTERLAALACREQTSLFVVLLSALKRLMQQHSGSSDIRVATNLASRHQRGVENMIGPLTDTLILRTNLAADTSPLGALWQVRKSFLEACTHSDIPFEELVRRLCPEFGIARSDLAQVFFLFDEDTAEMQGFADLTPEAAPVQAQEDFFKSASHDHDLILYVARTGNGMQGQLTLKGQLESRPFAAELLRTYRALLEELAAIAIAA